MDGHWRGLPIINQYAVDGELYDHTYIKCGDDHLVGVITVHTEIYLGDLPLDDREPSPDETLLLFTEVDLLRGQDGFKVRASDFILPSTVPRIIDTYYIIRLVMEERKNYFGGRLWPSRNEDSEKLS